MFISPKLTLVCIIYGHFLNINIWSHLVMSGHRWLNSATSGPIWSHLVHWVTSGLNWSHLIKPGHKWSHLIAPVTSGHTWSHLSLLVTSGHAWSQLVTYGHTCHIWSYLVTSGNNWSLMTLNQTHKQTDERAIDL